MKRIVSLVPSWTETLLEAGAAVVGRTRFCIHPANQISSIPVIGGTKSFDLEKIRGLKPDLILLDREENTREMAELSKTVATLHVTHVESVRDLPRELEALANVSDEKVATELRSMRDRYVKILKPAPAVLHNGLFVYCIWKDPWMAVGKNTFIASMLEQAGYDLKALWPASKEKYPKFETADLPDGALVLLSSEPYPFSKSLDQLRSELAGYEIKLVDGESYSWFGIRALRYLES